MLTFGKGNAKLGKKILTFSLPSGYSCPSAHACRSRFDRTKNKVIDGPHNEFRCFTASLEALYPAMREMTWRNFEALKSLDRKSMVDVISVGLRRKKFDVARVHVSGDYFSEDYFLAWREVAHSMPNKIFYSYTKRIDLLAKHGQVSKNHRCVASYGGIHDHVIDKFGLISAKVVFTTDEAANLGLEIDKDDSHAIKCEASFALLLHGSQPKQSKAAKALSALRAAGHKGYTA